MTNDACSFYIHVQKLEVFFTFLFLSYWQLFMGLQLKLKNLINSNVALLTLETRVHTKCSASWCCLLISALNVGMYQVKQNLPLQISYKVNKILDLFFSSFIYLSVVHFHVNETIFINLYCLYLLTLTRGRREGDRHPRKVPWTHIWGFPF